MSGIATLGRLGFRCSAYVQSTGATSVCQQNRVYVHQPPLQYSRGYSLLSELKLQQRTAACCITGGISLRHNSGRVLKAEEIKPVHVGEIKTFLDENNISYNEGYTCLITSCPKHVKKKFNLNEVDKLYINMTTGNYICHSCKRTGCWPSLKENMQMFFEESSVKKRKQFVCFEDQDPEEDGSVESPAKIASVYGVTVAVDTLDAEAWDNIAFAFGLQGVRQSTAAMFGVRCTLDPQCLVFPAYEPEGSKVVGLKILKRDTTAEEGVTERSKILERTLPRVDYDHMFGWAMIKRQHTELVLTASELDAMLITQQTGAAALALPRGDTTLPHKILPYLEQFNKIIIWLGNDMKAWQSAQQFARKLSDKRCFIIRPEDAKHTPAECVYRDVDMRKVLSTARLVVHKSITTFQHLRHDVYNELSDLETVAGVKWKRYPELNRLLKGHRRGELTILTGPTGSGKTTFVSDYSLDLCMQGVNTLWGSFEINNVRLMRTMLTQFAMVNLGKQLGQFHQWADKFELLPMYFMVFHGQENIRRIIETMSHAVYVHDISHVIVDNLQFMMGTDSTTSSDRYLKQDQILAAFRKFATGMNCHVTLVIHPRKEKANEDLTVSSIFGSAKASQEADNILILQDRRLVMPRGRKFIQVAKNRFDGELGVMLLKFNKDTRTFSLRTAKSDKGKDDGSEVMDNEEDAEVKDNDHYSEVKDKEEDADVNDQEEDTAETEAGENHTEAGSDEQEAKNEDAATSNTASKIKVRKAKGVSEVKA